MNPDSRIWLVIPVHNRREITRACLHRLQSQGLHVRTQILVVNDGSTDRTEEMIRDQFPWAHLLKGDGHLWWTGSITMGMRHALQHGASCICWLNDDCLPEPGALEKLTGTALRMDAICGGACTDANGLLTYSGGQIIGATQYPFTQLPTDDTPCDWLNGNFAAIPASVIARIGLPEEKWLPQTWGDVEYTYRAKRRGIPVLLLPSVRGLNEANHHPLAGPWLSHRVRLHDLWSGWWNKKAWWYLPSVVYFKLHYFHARGLFSLGFILAKMIAATVFKSVIPKSLQPSAALRLTEWLHRRRRPSL